MGKGGDRDRWRQGKGDEEIFRWKLREGRKRERERSGSLGKMEEMLKRKRKEMERSREIVRKRVGHR